jgi:hypothetical protein
LFDNNAWQGWEYDLPDPRARVHPELSGQGVSTCFYPHKLHELTYTSSHTSSARRSKYGDTAVKEGNWHVSRVPLT